MLTAMRPSPRPAGTEDLVLQAQSGDRAAFEQLYRRNVGRIHALCLRMAGDPVAAEELTQEVFVKAWRRLGTFRGDSAFSTWLHALAVREVLGDRRSNLRRLSRVTTVRDPEAYARGGRGVAAATVIDLERSLSTLPSRARQVFVLHDIEGYRHHEIATLMGTSEGTSKGQLHRARKLLREALGR